MKCEKIVTIDKLKNQINDIEENLSKPEKVMGTLFLKLAARITGKEDFEKLVDLNSKLKDESRELKKLSKEYDALKVKITG